MENIITDGIFRKLLMLDLLEGEKGIIHNLFPNYSYYNYMFIGPRGSGRTSLLFEYAFQTAEHNMNVLYITQKRFDKLPHLINSRVQPYMEILKLIEILYLGTVEEILKVMATMHLREKKYNLIIIDGIDDYLPHNKEANKISAKMCSFACDAVAYLRNAGLDTILLCSITSSMNTQKQSVQNIMANWIPNTLFLYPHHRGTGFIIKSQTCINAIGNNEDVDVKGVYSEFIEDKIYLK